MRIVFATWHSMASEVVAYVPERSNVVFSSRISRCGLIAGYTSRIGIFLTLAFLSLEFALQGGHSSRVLAVIGRIPVAGIQGRGCEGRLGYLLPGHIPERKAAASFHQQR